MPLVLYVCERLKVQEEGTEFVHAMGVRLADVPSPKEMMPANPLGWTVVNVTMRGAEPMVGAAFKEPVVTGEGPGPEPSTQL